MSEVFERLDCLGEYLSPKTSDDDVVNIAEYDKTYNDSDITPEAALCVELLRDAIKKGDFTWIDGRTARISFVECCDVLNVSPALLRKAISLLGNDRAKFKVRTCRIKYTRSNKECRRQR